MFFYRNELGPCYLVKQTRGTVNFGQELWLLGLIKWIYEDVFRRFEPFNSQIGDPSYCSMSRGINNCTEGNSVHIWKVSIFTAKYRVVH